MATSGSRLVSPRFPYLPVRVLVQGRVIVTEALIDTGFDGHVILPAGALGDQLVPDGDLGWILGDSSTVVAPYFVGSAAIGDIAQIPVVVTTLGAEALVGRGVTDLFTVILDHGDQVIVEA